MGVYMNNYFNKIILFGFLSINSVFLGMDQQQEIAMATARDILKTDDITLIPLQGGVRAAVFKAIASCVVRRMPEENSLECREREIAMAKYAAEAGFGPRILYVDAQSGIMVMESLDILKIPGDLFDTPLGCKELGKILRLLHAGPGFPSISRTIFDECKEKLGQVSNVVESIVIDGSFKEIVDACQALWLRIPQEYVSSHGDLHRNNLIYTSQGFRIIDYESVAADTPYYDLARVAIDHSSNRDNDYILLEAYFDRSPTEYEVACMALMKHVRYIQTALWILKNCSEDAIKQNLFRREYPDYLARAYRAGDFDMVCEQDAVRVALAYLREANWYFNSDICQQDKAVLEAHAI